MHPVICKIGPFSVFSYGFMLVIAFIIASTLACIQAKRININPDTILNFLFISFISGIIGARIFYVAYNFNYYSSNLLEIVMLQRGGLSWFGGLILGSVSGLAYLKIKKLKVFDVLDLVVPFLALAQALGRIGCLLNGCCYGKESKFGIFIDSLDATVIPTQIYSSLLLLVIYVILRFLQDRPHKSAEIFFTYLFLYSVKRFFIEFLRADNPPIFYNLTLFHIMSILLFGFSVVSLIIIRNKKA